jgi:hypothetical protein
MGTSSRLTVVSVAGWPSWVAWAYGANPGPFRARLRAYPLGLQAGEPAARLGPGTQPRDRTSWSVHPGHVGEPGELLEECQPRDPRRPVAVLRDDDLGLPTIG